MVVPERESGRIDPDSCAPELRPLVILVHDFMDALESGRIPGDVWQYVAPDHAAGLLRIAISQDSTDFRSAVATVLPPNMYEVVIDTVTPVAEA